jgi:hypothetical protein
MGTRARARRRRRARDDGAHVEQRADRGAAGAPRRDLRVLRHGGRGGGETGGRRVTAVPFWAARGAGRRVEGVW